MLEIRKTRVYRGPNVWTRVPSILMVVDIGELEDRPSNTIPGLYERLTELVPSLADHRCSRGYRGGFLERLREGTWMGHVAEHIALAIQGCTGADVTRGKTRSTDERGVYNVVFEYEQEDVGIAAGELAVRLLNHLIYNTEPELDYVHELEENVIRLAERFAFGPSTAAVVAEAHRRGIPVLRLDPRRSLVQLGHGRHQRRIWATVTSNTSNISVEIAGNKELTNRLLSDVGIPVPVGRVVRDAEAAVRAAERIGYPVVVKPLDGNHGRGVAIDLKSADEVRGSFPTAVHESRGGNVVVERYIHGRDYRILVVNNQVVAVAERVPARVLGDGTHTVRELIEITNADPRRGIGHERILTRISPDGQTLALLEKQGLGMDGVPEEGRYVQLKLTANMSTGGTAIDRSDEIHPDNSDIARQAAMIIGLDVAGIDFICPDIAQSVRHSGGAIVEVNAGPGFRMHTHPTEGHPRDVGRVVLDMLFPKGSQSRIPIVAVTGTNGKTTVVRMIAHIMKTNGRKVGLTTTDGIYIDDNQIAAGDMSGPTSAQMVLKNPTVDFAVLETARGGILRAGLGFDRCNIAVVTNVSSDHLGLGGVNSVEDLAEVKAVVPQSVFRDGASVLNADNQWTVQMASTARGEIIFFSMDENNPVVKDHLRERGRAVLLRRTRQGEMIALVEHKREVQVLAPHEIPATFGGHARVNIANALAAVGAAWAEDVPLDCIRQALRTFGMSFEQVPGRFNMADIKGRQVIMDYGHNMAALEGLREFIEQIRAPRNLAMITVPGDRRDSDVRAFAALSANIFQELVVRDNNSLRGRRPGEIPEMLREAAVEAGMPPDCITTVWDELESSVAVIERARPGELVVLMVDSPKRVWESLQARYGADMAPLAMPRSSAADKREDRPAGALSYPQS